MKVRAEETRKQTAAVQLVIIDSLILKAIGEGHCTAEVPFRILSEVAEKLCKLGYSVDTFEIHWGDDL